MMTYMFLLAIFCYVLTNREVNGAALNIEKKSISEYYSSEDDDLDVRNKLSDMDVKLNELLKRTDKNSLIYQGCPDGWVPFSDSCYHFGSSKLNFKAAKVYCHLLDSHMVIVETWKENASLKKFMKSRQGEQKSTSYWLGLTENLSQNNWVWQNNKVATFLDWGYSEPDSSTHEACAWFKQIKSYQWSDIECHRTTKAVCEKRKSSMT